jgi:hypothetical protein
VAGTTQHVDGVGQRMRRDCCATDHTMFFLGLSIIRLHYKMTRVSVSHHAAFDERDLIPVEHIL